MKSEHRHDLETNWLAHHMAGWIEKLKPHTTKLLVLAGIVVGLFLVVSIMASVRASKDRAAWDAYAMAISTTDPELMQLQRVAEEHQGTTMQEWAYATWADRQLLIAASRYLADRDAAKKRLQNVQGIYDTIIHAGDPLVRDRAHLGLARIHEMLDQLDDARREYGQVQGDLAPHARERSAELKSSEVQQACQWLATAELPKPASPTSLGQPGSRPPFQAIPPENTGDAQALKSIEELLGGSTTPVPKDGPTTTSSQGREQAGDQAPTDLYGEKAGSERADTTESPAAETDDESTVSPTNDSSEPPHDSADRAPEDQTPEDPAHADGEETADTSSTTEP
jgi:hypothetical protein